MNTVEPAWLREPRLDTKKRECQLSSTFAFISVYSRFNTTALNLIEWPRFSNLVRTQ
ncbi:MAG: hypothetical protein ABGZ35_22920 [Planctomycetaceae bacterium]